MRPTRSLLSSAAGTITVQLGKQGSSGRRRICVYHQMFTLKGTTQLCAGLHHRDLGGVKLTEVVEETVDQPVVALQPGRHARRLQSSRVRLAFVSERVELGRHDERWRQAGEIGRL